MRRRRGGRGGRLANVDLRLRRRSGITTRRPVVYYTGSGAGLARGTQARAEVALVGFGEARPQQARRRNSRMQALDGNSYDRVDASSRAVPPQCHAARSAGPSINTDTAPRTSLPSFHACARRAGRTKPSVKAARLERGAPAQAHRRGLDLHGHQPLRAIAADVHQVAAGLLVRVENLALGLGRGHLLVEERHAPGRRAPRKRAARQCAAGPGKAVAAAVALLP